MVSSRKRRLFRYWLPVYLYAGLIFYLSSLPSPPFSENPIFDIFPEVYFFSKRCHIHIIEYAILGLLTARACKNSQASSISANFKLAAALAAVLYVISDELHQGFVPTREMSGLDIFADAIGAALGVLIWPR